MPDVHLSQFSGLTLPSESESQQLTQNDTDSSGNSPATKRRKFRPVNGTEPHMTPSSTHGTNNFEAPHYLMPIDRDNMDREGAEPNMSYMTEEYRLMSPPIRTESLPDSGHGTTSVASTGKSQLSLKEKIAEIGKSLQVDIHFTSQVVSSNNMYENKMFYKEILQKVGGITHF